MPIIFDAKHFPPTSSADWQKAIEKELKGEKPYEALYFAAETGVALDPFYHSDSPAIDTKLLPTAEDFPPNGWDIAQDFQTTQPPLLAQLLNEAYSGEVQLAVLGNPYCTNAASADALRIHLDAAAGWAALGGQIALFNVLAQPDLDKLLGAMAAVSNHVRLIGIDYFANAILTGSPLELNQEAYIATAALFPNARVCAVTGAAITEAGGTAVQELLWHIGCASEYLDAGIEPEKIYFHTAIGRSFFVEIAKLRALRVLWRQLLMQRSLNYQPAYIHAHTANWSKTATDVHTNLIRTAVEAAAATIGGINSLSILPYDALVAAPNGESYRLARNQQLLLKYESGIHHVIDPLAGSYYVEQLTAQLVLQTTAQMAEMTQRGGFITALKSGDFQKNVKEACVQRQNAALQGAESYVGTNKYKLNTTHTQASILPPIQHPEFKGEASTKVVLPTRATVLVEN